MKNLALIIGLLCSSAVFAQTASINWMSIEEAVEAQKKNPKKIMIDVYTSWCGPCKMMMKNTFTDPNVIAYINENYYAVKFNAESSEDIVFQGRTFTNPTYDPNKQGRNGVHEFSRALQVSAYPTLVFMNEQAQVIAPLKDIKPLHKLNCIYAFSTKEIIHHKMIGPIFQPRLNLHGKNLFHRT